MAGQRDSNQEHQTVDASVPNSMHQTMIQQGSQQQDQQGTVQTQVPSATMTNIATPTYLSPVQHHQASTPDIPNVTPLQGIPPNRINAADWSQGRVQLIQQPYLCNSQGQILMPIQQGINPQQIQIIAAGKPFISNQLAPQMLTTAQGRQTSSFPGYTAISTQPATQNQFTYTPLNVINSQPSLLANSQVANDIPGQSTTGEIHKSPFEVMQMQKVGTGNNQNQNGQQQQCVQMSQAVLGTQPGAQLINPLQGPGQVVQNTPWQLSNGITQFWAPNQILIRGAGQLDGTPQEMLIQPQTTTSTASNYSNLNLLCGTETTQQPKLVKLKLRTDRANCKRTRTLQNIVPSSNISVDNTTQTGPLQNQLKNKQKKGRSPGRTYPPATAQKQDQTTQQPAVKQPIIVMNSVGEIMALPETMTMEKLQHFLNLGYTIVQNKQNRGFQTEQQPQGSVNVTGPQLHQVMVTAQGTMGVVQPNLTLQPQPQSQTVSSSSQSPDQHPQQIQQAPTPIAQDDQHALSNQQQPQQQLMQSLPQQQPSLQLQLQPQSQPQQLQNHWLQPAIKVEKLHVIEAVKLAEHSKDAESSHEQMQETSGTNPEQDTPASPAKKSPMKEDAAAQSNMSTSQTPESPTTSTETKNVKETQNKLLPSKSPKRLVPHAKVRPNILTHVIDGFVLQESEEPFPEEDKISPDVENRKRKLQTGQSSSSDVEDFSNESNDTNKSLLPDRMFSPKLAGVSSASIASTVPKPDLSEGRNYGEGSESKQENGAEASNKIEESEVYDNDESNCPVLRWDIYEVFQFIEGIPGCEMYAGDFFRNEIDGEALLLIRPHHLVTAMNMNLGPALKIVASIDKLRQFKAPSN